MPSFSIICSLLFMAKNKSPIDDVGPCVTWKTLLTTPTFNGNLGGIRGADQKCNDDAQSGFLNI